MGTTSDADKKNALKGVKQSNETKLEIGWLVQVRLPLWMAMGRSRSEVDWGRGGSANVKVDRESSKGDSTGAGGGTRGIP